MSIPASTASRNPPVAPLPSGITSPVTGMVSYGWISESWRLFTAQLGPWIVASLVLLAPIVLFYIAYYVYMFTVMVPNGFGTPPAPPIGANGLPSAPPTPAATAAQMNAQMMQMLPLAFGFGLAFSLWAAYLYGGMLRMAVRQVRGVPIEVKDVFRGGPLFGRMLGALLLLGLAAYGLEALCLAPMGIVFWRHGGPLAIGLTAGVGILLFFVLAQFAYALLAPAFALMADGIPAIAALKRSAQATKRQVWAGAGFVFVVGLLMIVGQSVCGVISLATIPMAFLLCALAYRDMIGMPDMAPPPALFYPPAPDGVWPPAPGTWPPAPQVNPAAETPQQYPAPPLDTLGDAFPGRETKP